MWGFEKRRIAFGGERRREHGKEPPARGRQGTNRSTLEKGALKKEHSTTGEEIGGDFWSTAGKKVKIVRKKGKGGSFQKGSQNIRVLDYARDRRQS